MEAVLLIIKARRQNQGEGNEHEPGDAFITLWTWEEYKLQGVFMGILQNIFHITSTDVLLTTLEFSPSECHLLTVPKPDKKKKEKKKETKQNKKKKKKKNAYKNM